MFKCSLGSFINDGRKQKFFKGVFENLGGVILPGYTPTPTPTPGVYSTLSSLSLCKFHEIFNRIQTFEPTEFSKPSTSSSLPFKFVPIFQLQSISAWVQNHSGKSIKAALHQKQISNDLELKQQKGSICLSSFCCELSSIVAIFKSNVQLNFFCCSNAGYRECKKFIVNNSNAFFI